MRALILSDIHANLEALNAVLAAAGEWDALWNLGDMVGYGGSPNEVIEIIRPLSTLTVRGNHDRACSGISSTVHFNPTARAAANWTFGALSSENIQWLRELPMGPLQPDDPRLGEAQVSLAHGSPLNEDQYILSMRDAWRLCRSWLPPLRLWDTPTSKAVSRRRGTSGRRFAFVRAAAGTRMSGPCRSRREQGI